MESAARCLLAAVHELGETMTGKTYDPKCYELAALFLSDCPEKNTEANRDQLAALIQRTIEDDIEFGMDAVPDRVG